MQYILAAAAAAVSGAVGAMGLGGGSVFLLYLTLFLHTEQLKAQGMNLLFFIPCAVVSLIIHLKNKLVDLKVAGFMLFIGAAGVFAGYWLTHIISENLLRKLFALFLLVIGLKEVFTKAPGESASPASDKI